MGRLVEFLDAVSAWADEASWRTWILHGLLALPIALLFGGVTAVVFYALREAEQLAHRAMRGIPFDWLDHAMDVLAPAVFVLALELVR